jgi:hypothetical protein
VFHVRSSNKTGGCNIVESEETENSESENANVADQNNVDLIFYAKDIIHLEIVPGKQTVNGTFYKEEVIKRLVALVHRFKHQFRKSGP